MNKRTYLKPRVCCLVCQKEHSVTMSMNINGHRCIRGSLRDRRMKSMYIEEKLSLKEIGMRYEITHQAVLYVLQRLNVPRRRRGPRRGPRKEYYE